MKRFLLAIAFTIAPALALAQTNTVIWTKNSSNANVPASPSNPVPVTLSGGTGDTVTVVPSSDSAAGLAPVKSSAVETSHVIKGSAGNLYSFNVSADATLAAAAWEVLIFNSTTAPSAGAVTPVNCYQVPAGTTSVSGAWPIPEYFSTGISITVSTATTCFTQTDSAHGFISANAK